MITNERQYRITNAQLQKLREALRSFDLKEEAKKAGSRTLAKAEYEGLESLAGELAEQVKEYEALRSGTAHILKAESLGELPTILVKARIAKGLSQRALAEVLGLKEQQIQRYEAGSYASASLRRLAEVAKALDLEVSEIAALNAGPSAAETGEGEQEPDWRRFPVQEMYTRNWFADFFSGSLADARDNAEDLVREFVYRALPKLGPALLRRHVRSGSNMDRYALLAWQCRVLSLAEKHPLDSVFRRRAVGRKWLGRLVRLSRHDDGPQRAKDCLEAAGIHFVIEPHLQQTYLDGAALLLPDGSPTIALTLRYDRLDNFWFVLVHELVHAIRHLRRGRTQDFFDDLDAEPDAVEREAEEAAGEVLLGEDVWETALARYVRTKESVGDLAKELGISSAIIAGRIRKEADNYTILADMVGQGTVRSRFPEVVFGQ